MSKETSRIKHVTLSLFICLLIVLAVIGYDILSSNTKCEKVVYNHKVFELCEVYH